MSDRTHVLAGTHADLYDEPMTDAHHALRLPLDLWRRYGSVVGNLGRTADIKVFMDWAIDHPGLPLGEDVAGPHDFTATFKIEKPRWELFQQALGGHDYSSMLRAYIGWRLEHPTAPLPGRRLPPLRRHTQRMRPMLTCV